jgi:hypothetical protein
MNDLLANVGWGWSRLESIRLEDVPSILMQDRVIFIVQGIKGVGVVALFEGSLIWTGHTFLSN